MMIFSISRVAASVRCKEAAFGNCTLAYRYPWSSSGKNPLGTSRPIIPVAAVIRTSKSRLMATLRMNHPQTVT